MARRVAATSSAYEVRGIATDVTRYPLARSSGMTFDQLEPSAKAPCTRTTFRTAMADLLGGVHATDAGRHALGDPCYVLSFRARNAVADPAVVRSPTRPRALRVAVLRAI